jgi:hypothetical protein
VSRARSRGWIGMAPLALTLMATEVAEAQSAGMLFHPVEPCRIFDTRTGAQGGALTTDTLEPPPPAAPALSSVVREFQVRGFANCNIPVEAEAITYNLTIVAQPFTGHLTLYPSNLATPSTSSLNFPASLTIANGGVVTLNTGAALDLKAKLALGSAPLGSRANIILDVTGYFAP